jgi:hypothetical protein
MSPVAKCQSRHCRAAPIPEVPFGSPRLGNGLSLDSRNRRGFFRVAKRGQKRGLLRMGRSDEYRRFAAECLKIERAAEDKQQRAIFLQMARAWLAWRKKTIPMRIVDKVRRTRSSSSALRLLVPLFLLRASSEQLPSAAISFVARLSRPIGRSDGTAINLLKLKRRRCVT